MGPLTVGSSITTPWAVLISGVATVIATPTAGVYQVIALYGTRSSTNFQQTVSGPISLVGVGLAGNNNNLLYVNSAQFPAGMDGQGWGYSSNASSLFPTASSPANMLAANTAVQLTNGLAENANGQSTAYSSPSITLVPWTPTATAPAAALPSSGVVASFSGGTVYVYQNQTVYVPQNNTVIVTQTVYVASNSSSGSSLSNGAIAGIVIGCSIGLSLLCVLVPAALRAARPRGQAGHAAAQHHSQPAAGRAQLQRVVPSGDRQARGGDAIIHAQTNCVPQRCAAS